MCDCFQKSYVCIAISPTPDRGPNPHLLEKRSSGFQNPHLTSPSHGLEKGVLNPKNPHFPFSHLQKKGGFLTENSPFQDEGKMGFLGPRNPLFQEMGIRGPFSGRGNPNVRNYFEMHCTAVAPLYSLQLHDHAGPTPGWRCLGR